MDLEKMRTDDHGDVNNCSEDVTTASNGSADFVSTDETSLVISAILSEFLDLQTSSPEKRCIVLSSARIILKLIRNAIRDDAEAASTAYRRIRLSNPKIKEKIVSVPCALDLLASAGFENRRLPRCEQGYVEEEDFFVFVANKRNLACANIVSHLLEGRISELEEFCRSTHHQTTASSVASSSTRRDSRRNKGLGSGSRQRSAAGGDFLGEEEKKERLRRAKMARKAKEAEREETKRKWDEDKREREETERRREAARRRATSSMAMSRREGEEDESTSSPLREGICIRPLSTIEAASTGVASSSASASGTGVASSSASGTGTAARNVFEMNNDSDERVPPGAWDLSGDIEEDEHVVLLNMVEEEGGGKDNARKGIGRRRKDQDDGGGDEMSPDDRKLPAGKTNIKNTGEMGEEEQFTSSFDVTTVDPRSSSWEDCLRHLPRCAAAPGVRETSVFSRAGNGGHPHHRHQTGKCLRRLLRELDDLSKSLPSDRRCSAWVRFDDETPQYLRALLGASLPGPSPYSGGLFAFDLFVPDDYPHVPPKVNIVTTGGGTVRFGPNLYDNGMVCLSILGTWPGPKWNPKRSSLHQVLVSIQSLLLGVEHPYYLEPGFGGWEGKVKEGDFATVGKTLRGEVVREEVGLPPKVAAYDDAIRVGTVRFAMLQHLNYFLSKEHSGSTNEEAASVDGRSNSKSVSFSSPSRPLLFLQPFEGPVRAHFFHNRKEILSEVQSWVENAVHIEVAASASASDANAAQNDIVAQSAKDRKKLKRLIPLLEKALGAVRPPPPPRDDGNGYGDGEEEKKSKQEVVEVPNTKDETKDDDKKSGDECHSGLDANTAERMPHKDGTKASAAADDSNLTIRVPATASSIGGNDGDNDDNNNDDPSLSSLRRRMKSAAGSGDYVTAGRLQQDLQRMVDVQRRMREAAREGNFVRAGRLQEQLRAFTALEEGTVGAGASKSREGYLDDHSIDSGAGVEEGGEGKGILADEDHWDDKMDEDNNNSDGFSQTEDNYEDDGWDEGGHGGGVSAADFVGGGSSGGLPPDAEGTFWFPPAGYRNRRSAGRDHKWGTGSQLGVGAQESSSSKPKSTPHSPLPTTISNTRLESAAHAKAAEATAEMAETATHGRSFSLAVGSVVTAASSFPHEFTPNPFPAAAPESSWAHSPHATSLTSSTTCRLRIRLPWENKSIVEEFNGNDKLSAVYKHLEKSIFEVGHEAQRRLPSYSTATAILVQPPGMANPEKNGGGQAVAVKGGAFARPLSSTGFTLLLSHPKREYNFEMHGSKTLSDLGLAPSATLTVMMCAERGVVRRGDLEIRLASAEGNAMDVDGLTYEGLLELTERVGVATRGLGGCGDGLSGSSLYATDTLLEMNSTSLSPATYLASEKNKKKKSVAVAASNTLSASTPEAGEETLMYRCPICLGDLDGTDEEPSLRRMHRCGHIFHVACLSTWLLTKSTCPICKQALVMDVGSVDESDRARGLAHERKNE